MRKTFIQLIKYMFVGGIAFILDFSVLFLLTSYLGIHYLISAIFGFVIGLSVNYYLSIRWVFDKRNIANKKLELLIFVLIGVFALGLNELSMWILTDTFLIYYLFSKFISTIFVYLFNFFVRKYLLFK